MLTHTRGGNGKAKQTRHVFNFFSVYRGVAEIMMKVWTKHVWETDRERQVVRRRRRRCFRPSQFKPPWEVPTPHANASHDMAAAAAAAT